MGGMLGLVTDIQRFCVHDGPGIRTTVFLKGCNLRCRWCHNPETIEVGPELQVLPEKCIACGQCRLACTQEACTPGGVDRARCTACGQCAEVCFAGARLRVGRSLEAQEVVAEVIEDRAFYENSGGGVTLSGGEPLFQREFALEILDRCQRAGIHTAIESNIAWPWEQVAELIGVTDLLMIDIKSTDEAMHQQWTGGSCRRILENARRLSQQARPLIVRTPVVAGFNDSLEQIGAIADLLAGFPNLLYYELLAYHPLGSGKYAGLGMEAPAIGLQAPAPAQMRALAEAARQRGIVVKALKDKPS